MKKRILLHLNILIMLTIFLAPSTVSARDVLRIGISPSSPPYAFKENGQVKGLEADMARDLARELGMRPEFVEMKWTDLISGLTNKDIDIIMSGMSITSRRMMRVNFSNPYFRMGQMALIRVKDISKLRSIYSVRANAKIIGVKKGTMAELYISRRLPKVKLKTYANVERGISALKRKRIDAFVTDLPIVWQMVVKYEDDGITAAQGVLTTENLGWAVRREDRLLLDEINEVLLDWKRTGRLEQQIYDWMPFLNVIAAQSPDLY